jgi:ABC-type phosphate transport system substrate-binding protein
VIRKVAEYQNSKGAIGYTFRYYATKMNANAGIKLLAIDGVAPTKENIRNETYPFVVDVYMVTRENPTAETQKLVAWFLAAGAGAGGGGVRAVAQSGKPASLKNPAESASAGHSRLRGQR